MKNPKKFFGLLLLFCVISLSGCDSETSSIQQVMNDTDNIENIKRDLENLKKENQKLREELQVYKNPDPRADLKEKYPDLVTFISPQQWTQVTLVSGEQQVKISDPKLIDAASQLFIISAKEQDLPNGPMSVIEPFTILLSNNQGIYKMDVVSRDLVTFPELTSDYFTTVSYNIAGLGKALLPKPNYVPLESMESRLLNSGMLEVREGNSRFYMISEFRVRNVAKTFLTSEKHIVSRPEVTPSQLIDDTSFYLYGEKIQMKVYPQHVSITDHNNEIWYETNRNVTEQLHSQISAG